MIHSNFRIEILSIRALLYAIGSKGLTISRSFNPHRTTRPLKARAGLPAEKAKSKASTKKFVRTAFAAPLNKRLSDKEKNKTKRPAFGKRKEQDKEACFGTKKRNKDPWDAYLRIFYMFFVSIVSFLLPKFASFSMLHCTICFLNN